MFLGLLLDILNFIYIYHTYFIYFVYYFIFFMYFLFFIFHHNLDMQAQPSVIEVTEGEGPVSVDLEFTSPWQQCGPGDNYTEYCNMKFTMTTSFSNDLAVSYCNVSFSPGDMKKTLTVEGNLRPTLPY